MRILQFFAGALIVISAASCTSKESSAVQSPEIITIDSLTVFMDYDRHGIARPGDIQVMENGNVIVADGSIMKITLVDEQANLLAQFGKEGKGPAEFLYPSQIHLTSDIISIVDTQQKKVIEFDNTGNFIGTYLYEAYGMGPDNISFFDTRAYYSAAGGRNNKLLIRVNAETDSITYFGAAKAREVESMSLDESKKDILNGEVPDFLKNMVTIKNNENAIYAFLDSYSEMHKYDHSGNLIWSKHLDLPNNNLLKEEIKERVKKVPNALPTLRYSFDIQLVEDDIYILGDRASNTAQHITKLNSDGVIEAIYEIAIDDFYTHNFAINPKSGSLYFTSFDGNVYLTKL